jgi:hypothetical protein
LGARIRSVAVLVAVLVTGAVLGTWFAQWLRAPGPGTPMVSVPIPSVFGERVRVEVLNGGGRPGMARAATGALRDAGFDVVDVGNWGSFDEPGSFVLDRVGRLETARQAADALGITDVRSEPDANLYVDLTVVLGQDWTPDLIPAPPVESPERPWWDLRQYLKRPSPAGDPDARLVDPENDEGRP